MIEFYEWKFDFKNMRAIRYDRERYRIMILNNEIYVKHENDILRESMMVTKYNWAWPLFLKHDLFDGYIDAKCIRKNKQLTQVYMTWCVEEVIFGPAEGR